jgi:hypothetical protein
MPFQAQLETEVRRHSAESCFGPNVSRPDGRFVCIADACICVWCFWPLFDRSRPPEVEQLISEVGRNLGQKAMYVEVQYFDGVRILRID